MMRLKLEIGRSLYGAGYGIISPGGGTAWSPAALFASGEQGAWYDPSDFTRYMGEKGPELSEDLDFDDTTKWTKGTGWSVTGGQAVHDGTAADYVITKFDPVVGKAYEYLFDIAEVPAGSSVTVYLSGTVVAVFTSPGVYMVAGFCTTAPTVLKHCIRASNATGLTTRINSFSIKEVTSISTATMFQDSAGTTPVTAVEQPVGLALDKRLGLVRGTEGVTNTTLSGGATGWTVSAAGTTISYPNGVARVISPGATPYGGYTQSTAISLVPGRYVELIVDVAGANASTTTLVVEMTNGGATYIGGTGYKYPFNGGGVYKTIVPMGAVMGNGKVVVNVNVRKDTGHADPGDWVEIRSISVRELPGNHASQATAAARPVLQQDGNGKYYLDFDGVDDNLVTGNIDFTATDKMTVVLGARWAAGTGIVLQGGDAFSTGEFYVVGGTDVGTGWNSLSTGSSGATLAHTGYIFATAPDTAVVTALHDIAGDLSRVRRNGVVGVDGTADKGTGNFGNYALTIGNRPNATLPFNGRVYGMIVRGAATTDPSSAEAWMNGKTGAY